MPDNKVVKVKMSDAELEELERVAEKLTMTPGEVLRVLWMKAVVDAEVVR